MKIELGGLFSSLPKEYRELIGYFLFFFLFMGGMQVIGHIQSYFATKCWEIQSINGKMFKLNACDGAIFEIDPNKIEKAN